MNEHDVPGRAPDEWELLAYADGRLDAGCARAGEIATWLRAHPQARQRVDDYARQDRDIRTVFAPKLAERVPAHLHLPVLRRRRAARLRRNAALAAVVVGALALMLPALRHAPVDGLEDFAQDVLQQIDAAAPVAAAAMAQPPPVSMPAGFELAGERRLQAAGGALTEQLYRDADGRRLRLFIGTDPRTPATEPRWLHDEGRHIVYWESGERRYALVSEIGMPELQQLAAQVMQAPDENLQLAGEATSAIGAASAIVFDPGAPVMLPAAGQPTAATPVLGIDSPGQIEAQPPPEQPLL